MATRAFFWPALLTALLIWTQGAQAQSAFPALTGPVVDTAQLLPSSRAADISKLLAQHKTDTSNQVVVATISSLGGDSIESYANRLFNHWGLGEHGKDNGVLLLVAPNERKVRIEVGDGLEHLLSTTAAQRIIDGQILPHFKAGRFEQGIVDGANGIIDVLLSRVSHQAPAEEGLDAGGILFIALFCGFLAIILFKRRQRARRRSMGIAPAAMLHHDEHSPHHGRNDGSGSGGGGGSSGGGGASGGW